MKTDFENHNIDYLRRLAKNLKKQESITHTQALNSIAQEKGYLNWKHLLKKNKFPARVNKKPNPYRNLLTRAINELINRNLISLNLNNLNGVNEDEDGYITTKLFGHNSVIIWRSINGGELKITVWFKYNHNKHPQANLEGNKKERFNSSEPLANRVHYPKFVGVVALCYLERKTGKYIQGEDQRGILRVYTRRGELQYLKDLPEVKPKGYKVSGKYFF